MQEANKNEQKIPFFRRVMRKWYVFLFSILICTGLAWAYMHFTTPLFDLTVRTDLNTDLLRLSPEEELLTPELIREALQDVSVSPSFYAYPALLPDFLLPYFSKDLYPQQPFRIVLDSSQYQLVNTPVQVKVSGENELSVKVEARNVRAYNFSTGEYSENIPQLRVEKSVRPGSTFNSAYLTFSIAALNPSAVSSFQDYSFITRPHEALAQRYLEKIKSQTDFYEGSGEVGITLKMQSDQAGKGIDLLKSVFRKLVQPSSAVDMSADSTALADYRDRISLYSDSLQSVRVQLDSLDDLVAAQSPEAAPVQQRQPSNYTWDQVSELDKQLDYLKRTRAALQEGVGVTVAPPEVVDINNSAFNQTIRRYNEVNQNIFVLEDSLPRNSPQLQGLREEFEQLSGEAKAAVNRFFDSFNATRRKMVSGLNAGTQTDRARPAQTVNPVDEQEYASLQTAFDSLDEELSLLRQEARQLEQSLQSQVASSRKDLLSGLISKVEARWPREEYIYPVAVLLGLLLPLAFIGVKSGKKPARQNQKLAHEQPGGSSKLAVLTTIPAVEHDGSLAYFKFPGSSLGRAFDDAKASLDYFHYDEIYKVIGLSSPDPEAGKTFCAMNLGASFAGEDRKVVFISADLSKPQESDYMALQGLGFTDYLTRDDVNVEQIVQSTGYDHYDYIEAGVSRLSLKQISVSRRLPRLFEELRQRYALIIVDNPDLKHRDYYKFVSKHFDINIFVLTSTRSRKLTKVEDLLEKDHVKNPYLLINESIGAEGGNSSREGGGSLIDNIFNS
jgi:Mrp family chromosome partitioning ATPase